ncbi:MAG: hypothetical protein JSV34_02475 [Candidatus Omnitrophota bacterium]|nr:MAG: hypothetical protein JSV34_02475 [Candidatus Omnitrophota bacterium]
MKLGYLVADKSKVSILEISLCFVLFFFLLIRGTYRGVLLPIMLFALPHLLLYAYALINRNIGRDTFNKLIFVSFCIFYIGIKLYRGMDCIGHEGDRDDALYQSVKHFLNGEYPYKEFTFLHHVIHTGPSSVLLSLPFVKLFNSIQVVSAAAILFLVTYLWRYAEKISKVPILSLALTVMIMTPFSNFNFWESGEELLYGLPFLYLAVIMFFSKRIKQDFIKDMLIGIFLGISLLVRMTYAFPGVVILCFVLFNKGIKNFIFTLISLIVTILIICFPFAVMDHKHFISHILVTWFAADVSFIGQNVLFFAAFIVLMYYYTISKWPLKNQVHILIGVSLFIGYIATGYISLPWHVLYWAIPFMITFPYLYSKRGKDLCH